MHDDLVQFQAQVMLKTIHPQQFHPVSCAEDTRVMGDRGSGINKATHTCHHQQSLELDQTHTLPQRGNNNDFPFWQFTLPGCALILAARFCRTAIQMKGGRFKIKVAVKNWLDLQAEIDKSVVVKKHQEEE
jgi:hypothetical protein